MSKADVTFGDADIRPALRAQLLLQHANERDTVIIGELGLCRGQVRIDLAVVNGLLHGYEIKSDRDTFRRLDGQVELYSKVLDRATLVVGDSHLREALDAVPAWWGILRILPAQNGPRFKTVRRGLRNPRRDPRSLVELLWLEHAIALLERHHVARGIKSKPRHLVWDRVCEHFAVDEIAAAVRTHLKARDEVAPLLGVGLLRERRRADEIAEEHGQLAALARGQRGFRLGCRRRSTQRGRRRS